MSRKNNLPTFHPAQLAALRDKYPKVIIKSDTPETVIKWSAAQQEVLDYIEHCIRFNNKT